MLSRKELETMIIGFGELLKRNDHHFVIAVTAEKKTSVYAGIKADEVSMPNMLKAVFEAMNEGGLSVEVLNDPNQIMTALIDSLNQKRS